jgi:hypothetical protein
MSVGSWFSLKPIKDSLSDQGLIGETLVFSNVGDTAIAANSTVFLGRCKTLAPGNEEVILMLHDGKVNKIFASTYTYNVPSGQSVSIDLFKNNGSTPVKTVVIPPGQSSVYDGSFSDSFSFGSWYSVRVKNNTSNPISRCSVYVFATF